MVLVEDHTLPVLSTIPLDLLDQEGVIGMTAMIADETMPGEFDIDTIWSSSP